MSASGYIAPSMRLADVSADVRKEIADYLSFDPLGYDWHYLAEVVLGYPRNVIARFAVNGSPAVSLVSDLAGTGITYGVFMKHLKHMNRADIPNYSDAAQFPPPSTKSIAHRMWDAFTNTWVLEPSEQPAWPGLAPQVPPPVSLLHVWTPDSETSLGVHASASRPVVAKSDRPLRILDLSNENQRTLFLALSKDWREVAPYVGFRAFEIAALSAASTPSRAFVDAMCGNGTSVEKLCAALREAALPHLVDACFGHLGYTGGQTTAAASKQTGPTFDGNRVISEILDSQEAVLREANKKLDAQRRNDQELKEKIRAELLAEGQLTGAAGQASAGEGTDASLCAICMDKKREYLVLPCAHNIYCEECQKKAGPTCPYCRVSVQQIVRIMTP